MCNGGSRVKSSGFSIYATNFYSLKLKDNIELKVDYLLLVYMFSQVFFSSILGLFFGFCKDL